MATAYLSQLLDDYRAWNLLGVCAALENNPTKASHYFHMAAEKGDTAAIANQKKTGKPLMLPDQIFQTSISINKSIPK